VGAQIGDWLPTKALKVVAGLAFIAIGAWVIWSR
jgi:putative Ca2+/H+ antiporter (TMEM165/GDT1 family)